MNSATPEIHAVAFRAIGPARPGPTSALPGGPGGPATGRVTGGLGFGPFLTLPLSPLLTLVRSLPSRLFAV